MWKSREDKLPPPSYFSMIVAYLQKAYKDARISRELMETLRPHFVEAWRNGKSAEAAAQTTCSCQHGQVTASPVIGVRIAKGSVRPPKEAQRGEVFGAEALRPPAAVERLGRRLTRIAQEQTRQEEMTARWAKRAQTARKESTQREATQKQTAASTRNAVLLAEARRIEAELKHLQGDLNRPVRNQSTVVAAVPSVPPPARAATSIEPVNTAAVAEKKEPPKSPRKRSPSTEAASASNAVRSPAAAPSAEGAAMLRAIQGLMPELAGQLASEMAKERGAK